MKNFFQTPLPLTLGVLVLLATRSLLAGDVKVIANSSFAVDSISYRDLKSIFLAEKTQFGGDHVHPVFERGGEAHDTFLRQYLGQNDSQLDTYYRTLVVTGRGSMPKMFDSDQEIVNYVSQTRGAIGYVSSTTSAPGVKVLIVGASSGTERRLLDRIEPEYPEELRSRSIGGIVRLRLTIAPSGNVENAELLGGNPVLGEAAIAAVTKWKFAPSASRTTTEVSIPFGQQP